MNLIDFSVSGKRLATKTSKINLCLLIKTGRHKYRERKNVVHGGGLLEVFKNFDLGKKGAKANLKKRRRKSWKKAWEKGFGSRRINVQSRETAGDESFEILKAKSGQSPVVNQQNLGAVVKRKTRSVELMSQ